MAFTSIRRHSWTYLLSAVVGVGIAAAVYADEPTALTEEEFLRKFESADPKLAVGKARIDVSRAEVEPTTRIDNPSVGYDREEVFPDSGDAVADQFVRVTWPFDISGQRGLTIDAAKTAVEATQEEIAAETFERTADALDAYYEAAYLRLRVEHLRSGRDELGAAVQAIRTRQARGDAAGYDLDRLELELGSYDDLITDAEAELSSARGTLARLAGEPEAQFDAESPLDLPSTPPAVDQLAARATQRADYEAAILRARQAEQAADAAGRSWIPDLLVTGGLKMSDLGTETATGYVVGINLEIPLFQRGQGDRARALAEQRQWRATARSIQQQADGGIRTAHAVLLRRIEQATAYRDKQVARSNDLLRAAEAAYREGERPIFELVDAYRAAREIHLREIDLRWKTKRAEIDLWRAMGRRP